MSNKFDFPSRPYPNQIWPAQKIQGLPQYIWSDKDRAWFKYKIEQYRIVPDFIGGVNEGETIKFLIQSGGVEDGTLLAWEIENITTDSNDFDTSLSGFVVITNNESTLDIPIKFDNEEEEFETFRIKLSTLDGLEVAKSQIISIRNVSGEDNRIYSVLPSSDSLLEGDNISFYIFTQNVVFLDPNSASNEKTLEWEILGLDPTEIIPNQTSGTLTLDSSGNSSIGFKVLNDILDSDENLRAFTFNLLDQGEKVSETRIEIVRLEIPPAISSLTASIPNSWPGFGYYNPSVSWEGGENLTSNDEIRMYEESDTALQTALKTIKVTGNEEGSVTFGRVPPRQRVLFAYYALVGDPEVEKMLKISNAVGGIQTAPPPPSTPTTPETPSVIWNVNNPAASGSRFTISGIAYTGSWTQSYSVSYVSGDRNENLSVSASSSYPGEISFSASPSSFSFGSSNSRSFRVTANVRVSPLEDKIYPVRFTLSSRTKSWTIYINFRI